VAEDDVIYQYNNATGYVISSYSFGAWDPAEPTVAVGEGFWSRKTAAVDWNKTFTINP